MKQIELKVKKLNESAISPSFANEGDAGMDFYLNSISHENFPKFLQIHTGIAVEIPKGYVGLLFDRSSVTKKYTPFSIKNSVGVIDSGYRGEILFRFNYPSEFLNYFSNGKTSTQPDVIEKLWIELNKQENSDYGYWEIGSKIGQMLIVENPEVKIIEVDELSSTIRNTGGFGSTGK